MARWLARRLWYGMLWLIRRPLSRKLQRAAVNLAPPHRREKVRTSMIQQERFARRIGLPLLTFVIRLFFVSVFLTFTLLFILTAQAEGWLIIPTREALNLPPEPE